MKISNFIAGTIAGTIVYYLLGGLAYGVLFKDLYPQDGNHLFIVLGCLFFVMLLTYIFTKWANISTWLTGAKAGAVIGLLYGLSMNFFMHSNGEADYKKIATDVLVNVVMAAITGAVIGAVLGMMNKNKK
jgi:heme/copper-type cytochrome/quinol oxidase subunit 4